MGVVSTKCGRGLTFRARFARVIITEPPLQEILHPPLGSVWKAMAQHYSLTAHSVLIVLNDNISGYSSYLLFQLTMITSMYLIFRPLQISATSSPFNVTITYIQLIVIGFKFRMTLQSRVMCTFGQTFMKILLTIGGFWNLEYFHFLLPPLCVTSSTKAIQMLLFDYVIAIYPLILTFIILLCLELCDKNYRLIKFLSSPLRLYSNLFCTNWNPKKRILNTSATLFLL